VVKSTQYIQKLEAKSRKSRRLYHSTTYLPGVYRRDAGICCWENSAVLCL